MSVLSHRALPLSTLPLLLALAGCQAKPYGDANEAELTRFGSCAELREYSADMMLETLVMSRYGGWGGWLDDAAEDGVSGSRDAPSDYTTTNVQEGGVDEIDLVKSDGKFVYVAQDRALHIVKSWPIADTEKVATVELDGWVRGLFLRGDKVVVFHLIDSPPGLQGAVSRMSIIDVSDRANPVVEREVDIEGNIADGRMIGDDVYVVINHYLALPDELWELMDGRRGLPEVNWELEGERFDAHIEKLRADARRILRPEVQRIARRLDLSDMLPSWRDRQGDDVRVSAMHGCRDLYRPNSVGQQGAMSIVNLDLGSGELQASGMLSDGWQIYASQDNLYVAQSSRWWWGASDRQTHIHQFRLDPDDQPRYVASGEVDGWVYDQFGFSELDGFLRVATTDNDWWAGDEAEQGGNNMFVLENVGGELKIVGEVRSIAKGERITAVRYIGKTAFMVTFRQVDPLFSLDLSDPRDPKVVGELKMPGFSAYLHPMGDDHLLAVGMDGTEDGQITGLAVNVFDVSDLARPELTHQYTIEGSDWSGSEALWDPHAFTYSRGVLSIPFYEYHDGSDGEGWSWFSGVLSLDASADGVSEIGRVDHRPLVEDSECLWARYYDHGEEVCDDWGWYAQVRRTVYIEDNLFSVSNYGVRVTDLNDPSVEHARVLFYPNGESR